MKKIERILNEHASEIIKSKNSLSKYYMIGGVKIRYSDHFAYVNGYDLSIVYPLNQINYYAICGKKGRVYILNAKEAISFIYDYLRYKKLNAGYDINSVDEKPDEVVLTSEKKGEPLAIYTFVSDKQFQSWTKKFFGETLKSKELRKFINNHPMSHAEILEFLKLHKGSIKSKPAAYQAILEARNQPKKGQQ